MSVVPSRVVLAGVGVNELSLVKVTAWCHSRTPVDLDCLFLPNLHSVPCLPM